MPAGGESHHADLLHAPFGGVVPAVTESVLNVGQRHDVVSVGHAVPYDAGCDAALVEPAGGQFAFRHGRQQGIGTARAHDDHLARRVVLGQINAQPGIGHAPEQVSVPGLGHLQLIGTPRTLRDSHTILDNALVHTLPLRIEAHDAVGSLLGPQAGNQKQRRHQQRCFF